MKTCSSVEFPHRLEKGERTFFFLKKKERKREMCFTCTSAQINIYSRIPQSDWLEDVYCVERVYIIDRMFCIPTNNLHRDTYGTLHELKPPPGLIIFLGQHIPVCFSPYREPARDKGGKLARVS